VPKLDLLFFDLHVLSMTDTFLVGGTFFANDENHLCQLINFHAEDLFERVIDLTLFGARLV
jgi:hypothetical protein